tara:strand:+ start:7425 stop:7649 length:225 start_codon:yes stop_codon:yes gene_type:complete
MSRGNCWVWFKGSLNESGHWKGGFIFTKDDKPGFMIENPSFVTCRVPEWRVILKEPANLNSPPIIPKGSAWKIH